MHGVAIPPAYARQQSARALTERAEVWFDNWQVHRAQWNLVLLASLPDVLRAVVCEFDREEDPSMLERVEAAVEVRCYDTGTRASTGAVVVVVVEAYRRDTSWNDRREPPAVRA